MFSALPNTVATIYMCLLGTSNATSAGNELNS